jgi:integrase
MSLGNYPSISLSKARTLQGEARLAHKEGIDLLESRSVEDNSIKTIEELANDFYTKYIEVHRKQPLHVKQIIDAEIIRPLGTQKLANITARTLVLSLETIVERGAKTHANKTLSTMKQMFSYAISKGIIKDNPLTDIKAKVIGGDEKPRERVLSMDEIKIILNFLNSGKHRISPMIIRAVKILLLTGVRSGELRLAEWDEINAEELLWTIPKHKTKTGIQHKVHLTGLVINLFTELKEFSDLLGSNYVIPSSKTQKDSNGNTINDQPLTDRALARAIARIQERAGIDKWTPHDLRRSFATQQGQVLKTNPVVIEKLLGHKMPKIMQTYNRDEMLDDRKEALEQWSDQIEQLMANK